MSTVSLGVLYETPNVVFTVHGIELKLEFCSVYLLIRMSIECNGFPLKFPLFVFEGTSSAHRSCRVFVSEEKSVSHRGCKVSRRHFCGLRICLAFKTDSTCNSQCIRVFSVAIALEFPVYGEEQMSPYNGNHRVASQIVSVALSQIVLTDLDNFRFTRHNTCEQRIFQILIFVESVTH